MEQYIGTKLIKAQPMHSEDAEKVLGREIETKGQFKPGYLVEYEDGYKSWSPKDAFEAAYHPTGSELDQLIKDKITWIYNNGMKETEDNPDMPGYSRKSMGVEAILLEGVKIGKSICHPLPMQLITVEDRRQYAVEIFCTSSIVAKTNRVIPIEVKLIDGDDAESLFNQIEAETNKYIVENIDLFDTDADYLLNDRRLVITRL